MCKSARNGEPGSPLLLLLLELRLAKGLTKSTMFGYVERNHAKNNSRVALRRTGPLQLPTIDKRVAQAPG